MWLRRVCNAFSNRLSAPDPQEVESFWRLFAYGRAARSVAERVRGTRSGAMPRGTSQVLAGINSEFRRRQKKLDKNQKSGHFLDVDFRGHLLDGYLGSRLTDFLRNRLKWLGMNPDVDIRSE
jgi:hypothetical protein